MHFGTLKRRAPKSNLLRQREFRERNPHYYRDLHRKRKAEMEARFAATKAEQAVKAEQTAPVPGIQTPLALPAARTEPLVTVQLPLFDQVLEPLPASPPPPELAAAPEAPPAATLKMQLTPAQVVERMKNAA